MWLKLTTGEGGKDDTDALTLCPDALFSLHTDADVYADPLTPRLQDLFSFHA